MNAAVKKSGILVRHAGAHSGEYSVCSGLRLMTGLDVTRHRLRNERLTGTPFADAEQAVRWLCAVQSQDYAGAKWGLALRTTGTTSSELDRLFDAGRILRTHVMRPTWHFVTPGDIRWLLALTGRRVHAANAHYYRKLELTGALFRRANAALAKALRGGRQLSRAEIAQVYRKAGIEAGGMRLAYLVMHAELDALVCSGPLRGKQFTCALLEERVPQAKGLAPDESLARLTRRYFASHGPAQVQDFAWWSGLTAREARAGIEMVQGDLAHETIHGKTYWFVAKDSAPALERPTIHLLPNYDEYLIAYKDHSASFDPSVARVLTRDADALQAHIVVLDGRVIGGWRRTVHRAEVTLTVNLAVPLDRARKAALLEAAERYGAFMEMPVRVR